VFRLCFSSSHFFFQLQSVLVCVSWGSCTRGAAARESHQLQGSYFLSLSLHGAISSMLDYFLLDSNIRCISFWEMPNLFFLEACGPTFRGLDWIRCAWPPLIETNASQNCEKPEKWCFVVFFFIFMCLSFILPDNLLGYIDWIPQRLEIQFSASHGGSLPGTTGCIHEGAYALSISNTTTEEQTANGIFEGTIFGKSFSSIYRRFSFFIASSIIKYVFLSYVSHPLCNYLWCQIIW